MAWASFHVKKIPPILELKLCMCAWVVYALLLSSSVKATSSELSAAGVLSNEDDSDFAACFQSRKVAQKRGRGWLLFIDPADFHMQPCTETLSQPLLC